MPTGPLPIASPAYGAVPMLPHMPYAARAPSQIVCSYYNTIFYHSQSIFQIIIIISLLYHYYIYNNQYSNYFVIKFIYMYIINKKK